MNARFARHVASLDGLEAFYNALGLVKLGGFTGHDGYDGLFVGRPGQSWHLEFTCNGNIEEDRSLENFPVLYYYSDTEVALAASRARACGGKETVSPNPYWQQHGRLLADPAGCTVMLATKTMPLSRMPAEGIADWDQLISHLKTLPYGRNSSRSDLSLVLKEGKGTCSSKHALLKSLADESAIPDVELVLAIYRMTALNTPGTGTIIKDAGLAYIPEAHCYLRVNGLPLDVTTPSSAIESLSGDILEEIIITAEQVAEFKIAYHRDYIRKWLLSERISHSFDEVWSWREQCIANLSQ